MSVNLLMSFHAINVQSENRKLFCGYVAPYVDPLCLTGTSFRFQFGRELIGVIKINVQGFIFRSNDSLDDYVREYEDLQKSIVCPQKYTKMIVKHFSCLE